jgi:hypothetical protein
MHLEGEVDMQVFLGRRTRGRAKMKPSDQGDSPAPATSAEKVELSAIRHSFWLTFSGLVILLVSFTLAVLLLHDHENADRVIPVALGGVGTILGTILGHAQGGASGQAEAARARKDADLARAELLRVLGPKERSPSDISGQTVPATPGSQASSGSGGSDPEDMTGPDD